MTLPQSIATAKIEPHILNNEYTEIETKAKLVPCTSLKQCAERILQNKLVSFPTETVYGLGANGLSPTAIEKIYIAKGRPKTSPLILHVLSIDDALKLWNITNDEERHVLVGLCRAFFPGPLTLISKANDSVPDVVTANTGFVAVRSPSHPIARELLSYSEGIPIAAPSANKFGHVSPTKAQHVYNDLYNEDVWIINEDNEQQKIGVESTVAKVDADNHVISILRHGVVSSYDIYKCLENLNLDNVYTIQNMVQSHSKEKNHVSPGQTTRHYTPNIPCYMLSSTPILTNSQIEILNQCIIIDYNQALIKYKDHVLYYKDLSSDGNSQDATSELFDTLRWAESVDQSVQRIYVPDILVGEDMDKDSLTLALKDRLTRAASGCVVSKIE